MQDNQFYWLDRTEYPFKPNFFTVNEQKLHYVDVGTGDTILFVHGTPSWSFDYRHIIKKLKSRFRCIAIDHIGFGLSDKPKAYDYSTQHHAHTLEKFILTKKLTNITLVVHDFGGPIGLSVAVKHPELISKIVIMNTWLWNCENEPEFVKLKPILKSPLLPFLYKWFNFSARFLLPQSFGKNPINKHLHQHYTKPFSKPNERNGTIAFARSLVNDQKWFDSIWQSSDVMIDKKILFVWGMKDSFISPRFLETFLSKFKHADSIRLINCGHFPQEECGEETANAILDFLSKS